MMDQVFRLAWCRLNGYAFRLAWNGFSMLQFDAEGIDLDQLHRDFVMLAKALHIMAEAAAAALRHCSYDCDTVPSCEELTQHFTTVAAAWEVVAAINAIFTAVRCGSERGEPDDEDGDDIDTISLKKN